MNSRRGREQEIIFFRQEIGIISGLADLVANRRGKRKKWFT